MDNFFLDYTMYPTDTVMVEKVKKLKVEESALDGQVRGEMMTRDLSNDPQFSNNHRPKW